MMVAFCETPGKTLMIGKSPRCSYGCLKREKVRGNPVTLSKIYFNMDGLGYEEKNNIWMGLAIRRIITFIIAPVSACRLKPLTDLSLLVAMVTIIYCRQCEMFIYRPFAGTKHLFTGPTYCRQCEAFFYRHGVSPPVRSVYLPTRGITPEQCSYLPTWHITISAKHLSTDPAYSPWCEAFFTDLASVPSSQHIISS